MYPFKKIQQILQGNDRYYIAESDFRLFTSPGGTQLNIDGGTVASVAGQMPAPTGYITLVSGALAITGIALPYSTFAGTIVYIPSGVWTWTAAGNIAVAGTTTAINIPVYFTYYQATAKWYPNRVA